MARLNLGRLGFVEFGRDYAYHLDRELRFGFGLRDDALEGEIQWRLSGALAWDWCPRVVLQTAAWSWEPKVDSAAWTGRPVWLHSFSWRRRGYVQWIPAGS